MRKLSQIEKKILTLMIEVVRGHLDSFTLFKRTKVSFPAFAKASKDLISFGYIEENEFKMRLTQKGREYILKNKIIKRSGEQEWKKIPDKLLRKSDFLMEMYIPSKRILDKKTFHLEKIELEE
jgi:predicted methyltransferase